jgi:RND family efflux transporter MFP subunit
MKHLRPPVLIAILLAVCCSCNRSKQGERKVASASGDEITAAVTQAPEPMPPEKIDFTGELQPVTQAEAISRFAGTVTELRVKTGDFVAAGSVIAVVRPAEIDQRIARFEALVVAAKQELQVKESAVTRVEERLARDREIFERDLIARRDVEQIESLLETARAEAQLAAAHYAQQKAILAQSRALQDLTRLRAPINGEVTHVQVARGSVVGEGTVILTLASLGVLKLISSIEGATTTRLWVGAKARVASSNRPNIFGEGKIVRIEPGQGKAAGTAEVELHLDNREKYFHPKMPVRASVDVTRPH